MENIQDTTDAWRASGACVTHDAELFFPIGISPEAIEQEEQAIAICVGCPVRFKCLELALKTRQDYGVWGGMNERQRKDIVNQYHKSTKRKKGRTVVNDIQSEYYDDIMSYV